ncbi:hypothetical protein PAPYR_6131 [Paratrimastix pyriformis]|uniref:EF-hand domain-containing protein n=1 Tax=Paratrimastix pyriformis TaxID=342808 RepID=A0ABQ8UFX8_9EUKA|nr:hypothetical protein PAPYR_6131 [Paratrimastix pyriformis]
MGNSPSNSFSELKKVASQVAPTEEDLRRLYVLYDQNGDGMLQRAEANVLFSEALAFTQEQIKKKFSPDTAASLCQTINREKNLLVQQIFQDSDLNRDATISFTEFCRVIQRLRSCS